MPIGPFGRLYTCTVVHPGKGSEPYGLAMVDFEPGVRAKGRRNPNYHRDVWFDVADEGRRWLDQVGHQAVIEILP